MSEESGTKINILPSQFEHSSFARQDITLTAEGEQTPDQFLNPNSYSSIAEKIQPRDKITVIHESMSWMLELIVVNTARHWVRVVQTNYVDLNAKMKESKSPDAAIDPYFVEHRGRGGWCVIRREDNEKLYSGLATQEEALKQKSDYEKSQGL